MSNCPACGAPLGSSTTNCPFCNYSLSAATPAQAKETLYNPPLESEPTHVYAQPEVNYPTPPEPLAEPEPEPIYHPRPVSEPSPIEQLAGTGQTIRRTGGKIACGIIAGVVVLGLLCIGAIILLGLPIIQQIFQ